MARLFDAVEPWAVVNAAGWVRVDDAEADAAGCLEANAEGAVRLARLCRDRGLPNVAFSSDLVFDGRAGRAYVESDPPSPLNVYGRSKARAEAGVLDLGGRSLVVRTAAFFSPYDGYNFAAHVARALSADQAFAAAEDLVVSPTYVPDLVDATLDLLIDGETGVRHLANAGEASWADFARWVAAELGFDPELVRPVPAASFGWAAARPAYAPLATERGQVMPELSNAIGRFAAILRESEFTPEQVAEVDREPSFPIRAGAKEDEPS
jgi:dTDP-4-dehydrorhamnose reductase